MTREMPDELQFPDELLSAYLDGEATAEERAAVEARLATNPADRQLLEELRQLRGDVAALPRMTVPADFASRVVRAAVAAKAGNQIAKGEAQVAKADARPTAAPVRRRQPAWLLAVASVAATAACLFIAVQFFRPEPAPLAATPAQQLIAALHSAVPAEGQALVLRLRLPKGVQLQPALAAAGILTQLPTANTGATELGKAYRDQITQKIGAAALADATVAEDAMFVEAKLAHLEKLLTALVGDAARKCELRPETQLAFAGPRPGFDPEERGIGETRPGEVKVPGPGQSYVQQLPPGIFRLEKLTSPSAAAPIAAALSGDMRIRVLILVERIDE